MRQYQRFEDGQSDILSPKNKPRPSYKDNNPDLKESSKNSFLSLYSNNEVLLDLSAKQFEKEWPILRQNQEIDNLNFEKWLDFYSKSSSKCHDLNPEIILCNKDEVIRRLYLDQRQCLIEVYFLGQIIFYDLKTNKKIIHNDIANQVIKMKTNKTQSLLGLAYSNCLFIFDMSNFTIKTRINYHYNALASFEFNPENERFICLGCNTFTQCGASIWDLEENRILNYTNKNYNFDKIVSIIYDKTQTQVFILNSKNNLSKWDLNNNSIIPITENINQIITPLFEYIDGNNQKLYIIFIMEGKLFIDEYSLADIQIEPKKEGIQINEKWIFLNYDINNHLMLFKSIEENQQNNENSLIIYDFISNQRTKKINLKSDKNHDFELKTKFYLLIDKKENNNIDLLSPICLHFVQDELLIYEKNIIRKLIKGKTQIVADLSQFKEEFFVQNSNELKIKKNIQLNFKYNFLKINPYNSSICALFSKKRILIIDFKTMRALRMIEDFSNYRLSQFFHDEQQSIILLENRDTILKILDINIPNCQNVLNMNSKIIQCFCASNSDTILLSIQNENEIYHWKYNPKEYKEYKRYDCYVICSFERDIKSFVFLKSLKLAIVNLTGRYSLLVYEIRISDSQFIIELKGHTQKIESFYLIHKKDMLISICSEKRIIIWDLKNFQQINTILAGNFLIKNEPISDVTYSDDGILLVLAQRNRVFIWDMQTSFLIFNFETNFDICNLEFNTEYNCLYTFTKDGTFKKWSLYENYTLLNKVTNSIIFYNIKNFCTFSRDFKYLFIESIAMSGVSHNCCIMSWPDQNIVKQFKPKPLKTMDNIFYSYQWTPNNEGVLFADENDLIFYHLKEGKKDWNIGVEGELNYRFSAISDLVQDEENTIFYIVCQDGNLLKGLMNFQKEIFYSINYDRNIFENSIMTIAINPCIPNEAAISDNEFKLFIYNFKEKKIVREFPGGMPVSYITFSHSGKKICICTRDSIIFTFDIGSEALESKLTGHKLPINFVKYSLDDCRIISSGDDSTIRVWNMHSNTMERLIKIYDDIKISCCEFCSDGKHISAAFNEGMIMKLFDFNYYIQQNKCIFLLTICKDFEDLTNYLQPWFLNNLAINFLSPFGFSIFHSLAYMNLYEEMYNFIRVLRYHKCKFTFFTDCNNKNIIDLILEKRETKILSELIEYLIEFPPMEDDISDQFNASILKLLEFQLPLMEKLLDSRIHGIKLEEDFYSDEKNEIFTKTVKNVHPFLEELREIFPAEDYSKDTMKLNFEILNFKDICDPKVSFCQVILEYPNNHPIFKSKAVTMVIQYKWSLYAKNIHVNRFWNFLFFTFIATLNSYYFFIERKCYPEKLEFGFASLISDFIIFAFFFVPYILYEVRDAFKTGLRNYFSEFWNWVDFLNLIVFTSLFIIETIDIVGGVENENINTTLKILQSLFTFSLWMKVLSFSIIYEETAFIYSAVIRLMRELKYFILLLIFLTLMFGLMIFILQDLYPDEDEDYSSDSGYVKMSRGEILFVCYKLILGDYDDFFSVYPTLNELLFRFLFIIVTLLMFIILMNFIISLVGMVFGEVLAVKDLTYLYEKNKIIAEIDRSMAKTESEKLKERKKINGYLMICHTKLSSDYNLEDSKNQDNLNNMVETLQRSSESNPLNKVVSLLISLIKPKENDEKEKKYFRTNIQYDLIDKINFFFGASCSNCNAQLQEYVPQYYCYFCDIYLCPDCGDKVNSEKKGSHSMIHPHNLVFIDVKKSGGMTKIDKYKMGEIKIFEENVKKFGSSCNGCGESVCDAGNARWVCLTCRQGKYRPSGYVDFCDKCMNFMRKRVDCEELRAIKHEILDEDHDIDSHIFLRIMFAERYKY